MRPLWHNKQQSFLGDHHVVRHGDGEVLIQSRYSLVSQGTERKMLSEPPTEGLAENMAIPNMKGNFRTDFTYGYSLVGQVVDGPKSLMGKYVHVLHPHQDECVVSEADVTDLPNEIDLKQATLISNLETVVNALWDGQPEVGDKILIIGYGTIGALLHQVLTKNPGLIVDVLELNPVRFNTDIDHIKSNEPYDLVYDASGSFEGLNQAIKSSRKDGRVVCLSWFGSKPVSVDLGRQFHYNRVQLISSQVSQVPSRKSAQWSHQTRKQLVLRLLKELDFSHLIQKVIPYQESPTFFNTLRTTTFDEIGIIIEYNN